MRCSKAPGTGSSTHPPRQPSPPPVPPNVAPIGDDETQIIVSEQYARRPHRRRPLAAGTATVGDEIGHVSPSPVTWAANSRRLEAVVTVTDHDISTAVAFAFRHLKVVAEPSGACAPSCTPRPTDAGCSHPARSSACGDGNSFNSARRTAPRPYRAGW